MTYNEPLLDDVQFKVVVVGDGAVGKTCLLMSFTEGVFPTKYVPTIFDNFTATLRHQGRTFRLDLYDTAGQEDYDRLRSACYAGTDIFLVCYCCDKPISLTNVRKKWIPEVNLYEPNAHILLVGLKSDLRSGNSGVRLEHCQKLKKDMKAERWLECSALNNEGVQAVFQAAADVYAKNSTKKKCCIIL